MKHLIIRNLGPLKEADVELKSINVIIGSQSSGKSCVLKTACYCTWVEKRIELTQTAECFKKDGTFLKELERFHKLKGYIKANTFISYETDFMSFSYDNATDTFTFNWKEGRWGYRRPKVTYIPAERNLVAAIPNWLEVNFENNNIRSFMADWETARQATQNELSVLNLDVSYHYDSHTKSDKVQVANGVTLDFTNTSSGLQSVIPLFVHLNFLYKKQNRSEMRMSIAFGKERDRLIRFVSETFIPQMGKDVTDIHHGNEIDDGINVHTIGNKKYLLSLESEAELTDICERFIYSNAYEIFLEEPEANLFPPTQTVLVEWLIDLMKEEKPCSLFIATHSPYILETFLEKKNLGLQLLYTRKDNDLMLIKTATKEDLQDIYDYGLDAFFNIETLG